MCKARATEETGSVVAILQWAPQCRKLAKMLGGSYAAMDELESRDLLQYAESLDVAASGCKVAAAILGVARECITKLPSAMRDHAGELREGATPAHYGQDAQR